ncbi:MAG: sulfotransferase [Propionicimonas sp.]|uniref:sulfotransferase family protein n=1 Tax=Propionicimonas sp. TaxID=1955623 RepID=UPI003D0F8B15
MEPDFIILGAQRAGTTTLFRVLNEHPDVVRPTVTKGTGYFESNYGKGRAWYRSHFPIRALARWRTGGRARTFESSGYYLFHPLSASRIAADLPNVRVVAMLRDPVERAYSAHRHELRRGFETEEFEPALALEAERLAGEEDRIRTQPGYDSFDHRHHAYVTRSRYADQVQRYVDALGPERVFIVDADRFFTEPQDELTELFAWLGLNPWLPAEVEQWNAQPREPMDDELRARLREEFAESDEKLRGLMRRPPSWRSEPERPTSGASEGTQG